MYIGESFPIFYISKNYRPGLTNVKLLVRRPDGITEGIFIMTEYDPAGAQKGIYLYDYTPTLQGGYLFTVFENGTNKFSKEEYSDIRSPDRPIAKFND